MTASFACGRLKTANPHHDLPSDQSIDDRMYRIKKKGKLKDVRVHDIRRTVATEALRSGMSLPAVQRAGGWRSINSVSVYARAELSDAQKAASVVESVFLRLDK